MTLPCRFWLVLLCASVTGCDDGTVVRDDDHIRYVVHGGATVDEESIDAVVEQVEELRELFGGERRKFEYHLHPSIEAVTAECDFGPHLSGCYDGEDVHSFFPVHTHELVHLVHQGAPPLIREGVANMLSSDQGDQRDVLSVGGIAQSTQLRLVKELKRGDVRANDLRTTVSARFFLDHLGWNELLKLGESLDGLDDARAIQAELEKAFDLPLAEIQELLFAWELPLSALNWWTLQSLRTPMEAGAVERLRYLGPALEFEHDGEQRTVLEFQGEGDVHAAIEDPEKGKIHNHQL